MEATMALSRGGKDGLAASSWGVLEGKMALGPALPPTANAIGVQVALGSDFDIGKRGLVVEEQDQLRPLSKVRRSHASRDQPPGLGEELIGETRAIGWQWSWHVAAPWSEQLL
jgi:hypothetical protein